MKAPIIYIQEIEKNAGAWGVAKGLMKNPWSRKAILGAGTGAVIGGTINMAKGTVEDAGKNFRKGAIIGGAGGAVVGAGSHAAKKFKAMNPTKQLLTGGGVAAAGVGGAALYFNQKKKKNLDYRPRYEYQVPSE